MNTLTLPARHNKHMDWAVVRDILFATGGGGGILGVGYLALQKYISTQRAAAAGDNATVVGYNAQSAVIERLEKHLDASDERASRATERADKAERERNEALMQISQLTFTIANLRDEVQKSREEVQSLRVELAKYAKQ